MRIYLALLGATALTACGGSGPTTIGGTAINSGAGAVDTFVTPTTPKTYTAQGAFQTYSYNYTERVHYNKTQATDPLTGMPMVDASGNPILAIDPNSRTILGVAQQNQLYAGNASTVRSPAVTVTYDPRNAQFTLAIVDYAVNQSIVFQDPLHRTDFSGARTPQIGVPNLEVGDPSTWRTKGVQYLEVNSGGTATVVDKTTFFYELPGTTTQYVTYAGYVRNHFDDPVETIVADSPTQQIADIRRATKLDRGAFVFGQVTPNSSVPTTGSGTFNGNMIASMVNNPDFDTNRAAMTYFQWISGTANVNVNFQSGAVTTTLSGTVGAPLIDPSPIKPSTNSFVPPPSAIAAGSTFTATSAGRIDLVTTGGFTGTFNAAGFTGAGAPKPVDIAGSSLDGAFYGPAANEVGASFRIVGGIPDQRVDIVGSFTAKGP
ncbi:transferrin-binding protein-like solute binding protein [Sphingomonas sp.]|uniref:transferrin-binding protein-like solute binding protein n=1 Tax=Sphingomonas sp. TaxID=28214 RepID=UPI0025EB092E|nr:transferrin-binding protein-like solute binding protein [Sphingomonas sp.]